MVKPSTTPVVEVITILSNNTDNSVLTNPATIAVIVLVVGLILILVYLMTGKNKDVLIIKIGKEAPKKEAKEETKNTLPMSTTDFSEFIKSKYFLLMHFSYYNFDRESFFFINNLFLFNRATGQSSRNKHEHA